MALLLAFALALGIVLGPVAMEALATAFAPTPVYASGAGQDAPDALDAYATHLCRIDFVSTDASGVHVQCLNPVNGISVFRRSADNPDVAARLLSVMLIGKATGQPLWIAYNDAASGNPAACPTGSCRHMTGAFLR